MSNAGVRPRLKRREAAAQTRQRLLSSARDVFVRRGYHGASIYEIAEGAGYSIGALYSHFGGKEGVFLALLDRHFDEQLEAYSRQIEGAEDTGKVLQAGSDFWTQFLQRDPEVVILFVEFWSVAMRDPELTERFADSYRRLRSALAGLIDEQRQRLGLSAEGSSMEAAIVFDSLIDGFALHKLADPDGVPDDLLGRALSWLVTGMLAESRAAETRGS
jgi:AcrR family transcriptional regulator